MVVTTGVWVVMVTVNVDNEVLRRQKRKLVSALSIDFQEKKEKLTSLRYWE
jgi:hypothetical protein